MAKVALIGLYDNWTLGLRTLSNALISRGHSVSIIHFKMPVIHHRPYFLKYTRQYQTLNTLHARDNVMVQWYNTDAVMWTHNETWLLGDLLEELDPDIIGLSTRCVYENDIFDLTEQMDRVPGAVTVAGGHDASFRPELYAGHVDRVCVGEGEEAMLALAEAVDNGTDTTGIPNMVRRDGDRVIRNELALPSDRADYFYRDDMHTVDHYLVEQNRSRKVDFLFRDIILTGGTQGYYTMAGRGCSGMCTFCSAGQFQRMYHTNGRVLKARRMRPIESIVREVLSAKTKGFKRINFLDSFFMARKSWMLDFFDAYEKAGGPPFSAQMHPEQVLAHPDILDAAVRAGLDKTVVGIQSGSERINQKVFNRKNTHATILAFARMCTARGNMKLDYHIITHNPFEAEKDYEEAIDLLGKLPKEGAQLVLRPLYPFKNTEIHRMIAEKKSTRRGH